MATKEVAKQGTICTTRHNHGHGNVDGSHYLDRCMYVYIYTDPWLPKKENKDKEANTMATCNGVDMYAKKGNTDKEASTEWPYMLIWIGGGKMCVCIYIYIYVCVCADPWLAMSKKGNTDKEASTMAIHAHMD